MHWSLLGCHYVILFTIIHNNFLCPYCSLWVFNNFKFSADSEIFTPLHSRFVQYKGNRSNCEKACLPHKSAASDHSYTPCSKDKTPLFRVLLLAVCLKCRASVNTVYTIYDKESVLTHNYAVYIRSCRIETDHLFYMTFGVFMGIEIQREKSIFNVISRLYFLYHKLFL